MKNVSMKCSMGLCCGIESEVALLLMEVMRALLALSSNIFNACDARISWLNYLATISATQMKGNRDRDNTDGRQAARASSGGPRFASHRPQH
eukprot:gene10479-7284_t